MNKISLYNTVFEALSKENEEIQKITGFGIFFAPELYLAFILGKAIKSNEIIIFGEEVIWKREMKLKGNPGPVDIFFEGIETKNEYVFEMKVKATSIAYLKDIEKLNKLNAKNRKLFFLALVDSFSNNNDLDPRLIQLKESNYDLNEIQEHKSFQVKKTNYVGKIDCTVALFELNPK